MKGKRKWKQGWRRLLSMALVWLLLIPAVPVLGNTDAGPEVGAPSAILMEASTGTVLYEKNADEPRNPASVTKIMTLILIFDALQSGKSIWRTR